jgi:hypothetical protein
MMTYAGDSIKSRLLRLYNPSATNNSRKPIKLSAMIELSRSSEMNWSLLW